MGTHRLAQFTRAPFQQAGYARGCVRETAEVSISKQDFYEGAALSILARTNSMPGVVNCPPFYVVNGDLAILLKYCTKGRSPWSFTLTALEQAELIKRSKKIQTTIGLICGADGVVSLSYDLLTTIAVLGNTPIHISCYRRHGEYYEVSGPLGPLEHKISPSSWSRILD